MNEHPSFLRLDRHALGRHDAQVAEHLASCALCARHVESIVPRLEVPEWVIHTEPARRRWWWTAVAAPLAAVMAGVYLSFGTLIGTPDSGYLGAKGPPSVSVYKKRGEQVVRWNGEAVHAGDALALRVSGGEFTSVGVLVATGNNLELVHREEIGAEEVMLPLSLVVDSRGDREQILVVFSKQRLTEDMLKSSASARASSTEIHTVDLELKKEVP